MQETLEDALSTILRHQVVTAVAGRTDAGVHARGQVVSFDADAERLDVDRITASVNSLLGPIIAVRDAAIVGDDFDARFSCIGRTYHYQVLNSPTPDPLQDHVVWHVRRPLDFEAMEAATELVIGTHDFSSFCRRKKTRPDEVLIRRVHSASWERDGEVLRFEISARAFCHQMVRSIVCTLVEVGKGRRRPDDIPKILHARDREAAGSPAPPHGLVLHGVRYP